MGAFDFIGDAFNKDARRRAASAQHDAIDTYKSIDPNITAQETGANAYDTLDPSSRNAQTEAYNRLANIGAKGGMDAGSRAALQQANFQNAQQAKGATDAALERASAEGRLNSGRALSAQMQAGQGAANANAMAGTQAVADARGRALNALAAGGTMAGQARGQDQAGAAAQNQLNAFNAQQRQGAQQSTVTNSLNRASGVAAGDQAIAGADQQRAQQARDSAGAIGDAVVTGVTKGLTGGLGGGGGSAPSNGSEYVGYSQAPRMLADGGMVDGKPLVSGDSPKNDVVPAKLSPGELIVPRSIVSQGPDAIREYALRLLRGE